MSTESQRRIAREAALEIETDWKTATVDSTTAIILTAIERSTEKYRALTGESDEFIEIDEHGKVHPAQPRRSEHREWTPENLTRVCNCMGVSSVSELHKAICDAHNAALTAEREKGQQECDRLDAYWQNQLATERQRYADLDDHCCNMRQQLLSALAAIEEHRREIRNLCNQTRTECPSCFYANIDLSLLHNAGISQKALCGDVELHQDTKDLIVRFSRALAEKLSSADAGVIRKVRDALSEVK